MMEVLASNENKYDWDYIAGFHRSQIEFMQHERLIHLMVTLSFGVFLLISLGITVLTTMLVFGLFDLLFLALLIPYIIHYFRLENGVQRWYHLANEIENRRGKVSVKYENGKKKI
jgi:hypothetical protein